MDGISRVRCIIDAYDSLFLRKEIKQIKIILMEYYNYIKALHLIFVITWFAGLFYIPRLFIYHIEATQKTASEQKILSEQLKLMAKRLWYIITWPSAILATIFVTLASAFGTLLDRTTMDACQTCFCWYCLLCTTSKPT